MAGNTNIGTAFLKIVGEVDKSTPNKITDEFKSIGQKSSNYFTDGFKTLGKKLIGAFGAYEIGKKIGETIFDAASAYADFEQLLGGVEKIFDQADQAQILKDAQNAYKDLNLSVNEYLSSINQVGATFAQTMGDQKGYDVARKGMKAIADYSSGTGRNLEELNQKYGLIIRSAASYQSIADQFSGILPATSADFLAQAQAAGILSDKYTKLTEVPIAEYQEAVTLMLEKGVADMGLLGNTAAETEHTLSGSIAGMKSAWENFLVALGDPNGDIESAMDALLQSIGAVSQNVIPIIGNIISELIINLPEMIVELAPVLLEAVGQMLLSVGEKLESWMEEVMLAFANWFLECLDGIGQWFSDLGNAISSGIDSVVEWFATLPDRVLSLLYDLASQAYEAGRDIVVAFGQGILANFSAALDPMASLAEAASGYLPHSPAKVGAFSGKGYPLYSGMAIADSLGEGFTKRIGSVTRQIAAGMDSLASAVNGGVTNNTSISMSVTADSTTTLDNLVAQARRARALNGGY